MVGPKHYCFCLDKLTVIQQPQSKTMRDDPVVARFKDCIDDFKQIMPLVEECANPALQKRHW
jgi:hypothetical protein